MCDFYTKMHKNGTWEMLEYKLVTKNYKLLYLTRK